MVFEGNAKISRNNNIMIKLSVILPVHNEKNSIEKVLSEWKKELDKQKIIYSFIICEDGSTDGTKELLIELQEKYPLELNQKQQRRGYGTAVIDGIKSANSEYILCIDSDGQCDPNDFSKFWNNRKETHVTIGWREKRADPLQRKVFSFLFKTVFLILFPTNIHDPSAPFVLFKKQKIMSHVSHLVHLKEGFWWGFVGMCTKKNLTIHEHKINHRKRINGTTQVYKPNKILGISVRNLIGLFKLKLLK
jgi:dolichol-phosphate mannosyltransferase